MNLNSIDHMKDKFWVVAVLNNPLRFKRRAQLFREFIERMNKYSVNICAVELVYGDRNFETDTMHVDIKVQLRQDTILWHKENMINIGISKLPSDWKYVAWIDTDIDFVRSDWVEETIHQLQHHPVVQLFEDAIDLGPDHQVMNIAKSFAYCHRNKLPPKEYSNGKNSNYYYTSKKNGTIYWHPGYAWAATRDAINTVGGLLEIGIVGSGDHHAALALIGEANKSLSPDVSRDYKDHVLNWEKRALRLHKNLGYVKGTIYHYWHGKKKDRKYNDRWRILVDNNFQPTHDLHKDWQGLLTFHESNFKLRDDIYEYFNSRNEDSIDL